MVLHILAEQVESLVTKNISPIIENKNKNKERQIEPNPIIKQFSLKKDNLKFADEEKKEILEDISKKLEN